MGAAIDTIVLSATNPGAAPAADNAAANSGDSKTVRNFNLQTAARIQFLSRQGTTAGFVGVKSPRMHDSTRGLQFILGESPAVKLLPEEIGQPVWSGDTLQATLSGGAAEVDGMAYAIYYDDLGGINAKLRSWADILPYIVNLKPLEVDVTQGATAFAWVDTLITATENLLKADTYYAVLGYTSDVAALVIGIKGVATGNLRVCGPGPINTLATDDYFLRQSAESGRPNIPVFSADDRGGVFVSLAGFATAGTTKVTLMLAELASNYQS